MNLSDLSATLEYWLIAGIDCLSSDRLEFPSNPISVTKISPFHKHFKPSISTVERQHPVAKPTATTRLPPQEIPVKPPAPTALTTVALSLESRKEKFINMTQSLSHCNLCSLANMRRNMVFGVGSVEAPVVFIGEAPGAEEDLRAEPFVGDAGKLLDKMILAIQLLRQNVYIANVVKCHPPANRNPLPQEIELCQPFLFEQLETIRPKVIFALGKFAILCLLGYSGPIENIRGNTPLWRGIPVIPSYHPAFYLRSPSRKKAAWEDLIRLKKMLSL